jgi:hypothetical protein
MSIRKLVVVLAVAAGAQTAQAQVSRVFVSVTGNDANVCSDIATPCRTLGGGITQVDPQGEVIVVASGSYAGGTITKSVKINVASGVVAFSGLAITIDPGAGGTVVIRGLTLKSATPGSGDGISHLSGTLFLERTVVDGWFNGLRSQTGAERLLVSGSVFRNNANNGLWVSAAGSTVLAVDDSFFENNVFSGLSLSGVTGRVSNSVMTGNGLGANTYYSGTAITFQRCEVSSNTTGLSGDDGSVLRVSNSTIVRNGTGLRNPAAFPGTVESFDNNVIRGNVGGNNIDGTVTTVALQ